MPNAKEEIWNKYVSLNMHFKFNYMKSKEGKLDRHKVAACYLIAISSVKPMRFVGNVQENARSIYFVLNEMLVIIAALSLLRAFVIAAIHENVRLDEDRKKELVSKFEGGILLPTEDFVNHSEYINNFASEIHYTTAEGKINILSVFHELHLLEVITYLGK